MENASCAMREKGERHMTRHNAPLSCFGLGLVLYIFAFDLGSPRCLGRRRSSRVARLAPRKGEKRRKGHDLRRPIVPLYGSDSAGIHEEISRRDYRPHRCHRRSAPCAHCLGGARRPAVRRCIRRCSTLYGTSQRPKAPCAPDGTGGCGLPGPNEKRLLDRNRHSVLYYRLEYQSGQERRRTKKL